MLRRSEGVCDGFLKASKQGEFIRTGATYIVLFMNITDEFMKKS